MTDTTNQMTQEWAARPLSQMPHPPPEASDPNAVLKYRFLKKGGGALLIAPSGIGKSVFAVQASILWSAGLPMMGIAPARPLRIAIIQGEDDDEDMAEFRDDIIRELSKTVSPDVLKRACDSVTLLDFTGKRGEAFLCEFKKAVDTGLYDLFIVNPLHSYFEGDLSQAKDCSLFFRLGIDPIIKPDRAAVLFIHHTGKPPASHERRAWGLDTYSEYIGNGSAELTNWPRATLVAVKHHHAKGYFVLSAPKRGVRLGWKNAEGLPTTVKYIAHGKDGIYWREATRDEVESVARCDRPDRRVREDEETRLLRCMEVVRESLGDGPLKASELKARFEKPADANFAIRKLNEAESGEHGIFRAKSAYNNATFYALDAKTAEASAASYSVVWKNVRSMQSSNAQSAG